MKDKILKRKKHQRSHKDNLLANKEQKELLKLKTFDAKRQT